LSSPLSIGACGTKILTQIIDYQYFMRFKQAQKNGSFSTKVNEKILLDMENSVIITTIQ